MPTFPEVNSSGVLATGIRLPADGYSTTTETLAGTATNKAVTPAGWKAALPYIDVRSHGAVGDGTTDDTAAIQAAINAAEAASGGRVQFVPGDVYRVTAELLLPSNVWLVSGTGGGQIGGGAKLDYAGAAGPRMIGPKNRAIDTVNVGIDGVEMDGNALVDVVVDLYRISYSTFRNFAVYGAVASTGVGILLDANVSNQCYFNSFDGVKVDGLPIGVRFRQGANANIWRGGRVANGGTGMEFLSLSSGNLIQAVDTENNTVKHYSIDAPGNVFFACHLESCPIGFDITANGTKTHVISPTFAGSVTTWMNDAATVGINLVEKVADTFELRLGTTIVSSPVLSASTALNIDPQPLTGSSNINVRLFRFLTSTGTRQFCVFRGDGTATSALLVDCGTLRTTIGGPLQIEGQLDHNGTSIGFYGAAPITKPTVTGAKGSNAALGSLLTALAGLGLITDSSTT